MYCISLYFYIEYSFSITYFFVPEICLCTFGFWKCFHLTTDLTLLKLYFFLPIFAFARVQYQYLSITDEKKKSNGINRKCVKIAHKLMRAEYIFSSFKSLPYLFIEHSHELYEAITFGRFAIQHLHKHNAYKLYFRWNRCLKFSYTPHTTCSILQICIRIFYNLVCSSSTYVDIILKKKTYRRDYNIAMCVAVMYDFDISMINFWSQQ